jgi:pimeloyl-ACP methyl ester carboxylesterase
MTNAAPPALCVKGAVVSCDGTTIDYRQLGTGPGVILVHGGMKVSHSFRKLAAALSSSFTVYLPDRRGRGLSGPHGDRFGVMREVEDMQAIVAKTEASSIFGLSSGALVALRATLTTPAIKKAALYEPPLSINGSVPTNWVPRYERELAEGRLASAVITAMKGVGTEPVLSKIPRTVLLPFMALVLRFEPANGDDVPLRALIPTQRFDMQVVKEMSDTLQEYSSLQTPVLLLGGTKGPAYLQTALTSLSGVLPHARRVTLPGLAHDGPEDDGRPDIVATELRHFFDDDTNGRPIFQ